MFERMLPNVASNRHIPHPWHPLLRRTRPWISIDLHNPAMHVGAFGCELLAYWLGALLLKVDDATAVGPPAGTR